MTSFRKHFSPWVPFLLLPLVFSSGGPISGADGVTLTDAEIAEQIALLAHDDFVVREEAAEALLKAGEAARTQVTKAANKSASVEVRARALRIIMSLDLEQMRAGEMHVVGLSEATHSLHLIDPFGGDTKWPTLCAELASSAKLSKETLGKRIWERLDSKAQAILENSAHVLKLDSYVEGMRGMRLGKPADKNTEGHKYFSQLSDALVNALQKDDLCEYPSVKSLDLDGEARDLLSRYPILDTLELWVLNRRAFEAAFPGIVEKMKFSLENATVTVDVLPTKSPINLVLCSYSSVRWSIRAHKNAKIKNVILSGYDPQMVIGTTAKVYAFRFQRASTLTTGKGTYFYAYKKDAEKYPHLSTVLRGMTGMEVDTFQGRYKYDPRHAFVVGGISE